MARMRVESHGLGSFMVHFRNDAGENAHVQLYGAQIVNKAGEVLFPTREGLKTLEQADAKTPAGGIDLTVLSQTASLPGDTGLHIRPAGEGPIRVRRTEESNCGAALGPHLIKKGVFTQVQGLSELRFSRGAASGIDH